jgi:hypothetical protein
VSTRLTQPPTIIAPALYVVASFLMFGTQLLGHHDWIVGFGADPQIFVWAVGWWPHAIAHDLDPVNTQFLYYPDGFDLAHAATVPAAAILLWPLTAVIGPLSAYNVAMTLSSALAASFAFLLCRRLTASFWPSAVGGWLFGFSPYVLGEMGGHLHLTWVFMVPAIVHLALRGHDGELSRGRLVVLLILALTLQFYISAEVFVSLTLFGAVAIVVAYAVGDQAERSRLREMSVALGWGYLGTVLLAAPYLYQAFQPGQVPVLLSRSEIVSADLLAYVVPEPFTQLGGSAFGGTTAAFTAGTVEGSAYLAPPVILIAALGVWRCRRTLGVKVGLITLAVVVVCSFGGHLHVDGHSTVPMPWAAFSRLPVLGLLLPARFIDYAFLIVAIFVALWLARARNRLVAATLAALAVAFTWPALDSWAWVTPTGLPPLFATGAYRRYISPRDVAIVLPIGNAGPAMLWQAEAGYEFPIAGGYVLPPEAPNPYKSNPLYDQLSSTPAPQAGPAVAYFLAHHGVTVALLPLGGADTPAWQALLQRIGWRAEVHGGVVLMRPART